MTRKDYERVAAIIRHNMTREPVETWAVRDIAGRLAEMFAEDNPRFDSVRFFDACGL